MPRPTHYSPQIRRDLITKLYFRAKAEKTPMTQLTNRLLDAALCRVADSPPTPAPQIAA